MNKDELLERYEALGELADYLAAKPLFERAIEQQPTALVFRQYGYLLQCHGRSRWPSGTARWCWTCHGRKRQWSRSGRGPRQ